MRKAYLLLLILPLIFVSCSKDSSNNTDQNFQLTVIVYIDNVPTADIEVTVGYVEFSRAAGGGTPTTTVKKTDSEGKVEYSFRPFDADVQYLCRVKNPFTRSWTDYRQANALRGQHVEEKYYLSSQD